MTDIEAENLAVLIFFPNFVKMCKKQTSEFLLKKIKFAPKY